MSRTTPTARALEECRKLGMMAETVERWISQTKTRRDLFGVFDILAVDDRYTYGIQVTTGSNHADRRRKISLSPKAVTWLRSPHRKIEVWSYSKKKIKRGGVAFKYELRRENLTAESLALEPGVGVG